MWIFRRLLDKDLLTEVLPAFLLAPSSSPNRTLPAAVPSPGHAGG